MSSVEVPGRNISATPCCFSTVVITLDSLPFILLSLRPPESHITPLPDHCRAERLVEPYLA